MQLSCMTKALPTGSDHTGRTYECGQDQESAAILAALLSDILQSLLLAYHCIQKR